MFSAFTSILPSWSGAKQATTGSVDMDLEIGDESRSRIDDDRLSSVSSLRVADSYPSSVAGASQERYLPYPLQDELDDDNDVSTSGCGMGPSSEESAPVAVPEFLSTLGRSASTPPEILRVNHPPDSLQQLQDQDQIHSSTSSSSNHSYTRFFHRTRTPNHTRSLGSGGTGGLSLLSPIYEPPNSDSRGTQKGGEGSGSSMSQKKTQAPSIHSTTSTIQERIMYLQASHPGFLKRPVNRTISQTSSSSLHSEVSGAPQLPPLHFRPAFTGATVGIITPPSPAPSSGPPSSSSTPPPSIVVVPPRPSLSTTSPQHAQLSHSQPNTPQSLTTPRSHRFGFPDHPQKCSAIYEDSTSEKSFVTAESGETEPGPGVITKHDIPSTADLIIYPQDQEQTEQEPGYVEAHERDVQELPSSSVGGSVLEPPRIKQETERHQSKWLGESETTFNVAPDPEKRPGSTVHATPQKHKGTGRASIMSIASTTVKNESVTGDDGVIEETATVVEDDQFIMERWMKTLFYSASGGREYFSTGKGREQKQYPVSSACILFWVGFVAPWCWLVGGWMPPRDAPSHENEMKDGKLKKVGLDVDGETVSQGQGQEGGWLKKWVLPDPSSSFKATARVPSISSATTLCSKEVEEARTATADPWVRRCRIASIVGGAILGLGLIAMVVVLAVVRV